VAVSLDLLTRVRNIRWKVGGTVFAIGDDHGYIWHCTMAGKTAKPTFKVVGQIGPDNETPTTYLPPGEFFASSYALIGSNGTRTFILGGNAYVKTPATKRIGAIWLSNDATIWKKVWTGVEERGPVEFVWDESQKKFYAWMLYHEPDSPEHDGGTFSECWSSSDGKSWTLINSVSGLDVNPVFESHCRYKYSPAAGDLAGKGLADGKFGFDPAKGENGLLITVEGLGADFNTVTFAGGIWGRGGPFGFDVSVDDAVHWAFVGQVGQPPPGLGQTAISTAIAGPLR
jgi:hypothetical protein